MSAEDLASAFRFSREELKLRLLDIETALADVETTTLDVKKPPSKRTTVPSGSPRNHVHDLVYGEAAVASVTLNHDKIISLSDVHNLLLWVLAEGSFLPWALVEKKPLVKKCVMLYITGIDVQLWEEHKEGALKSFGECFGTPCTTVASHPTTTAVQSVSQYMRAMVKSKGRKGHGSLMEKRPKKRQKQKQPVPCSYEELLATPQQLLEFGIPQESVTAFNERGFIETPAEASEHQKLVALDCEMCETSEGSELTRMSLIDENGEVLVDELVKPSLPIVDYRTEYSGITKELLEPVTTDLARAQSLFCKYVTMETMLVGHSLENDLAALQIFHKRVIDTSIIYPHPAGFPRRSSLRYLAKNHLGKVIQDGAHDSIMDARIALELVKLKKEQGLDFGLPRYMPTQFAKLTEMLSEQKRVSCMVDRHDYIQRYSTSTTHSIPCQSDEEVSQKLLPQLKKNHDFIWAQFQGLYRFYMNRTANEEESSDDGLDAILQFLDATVRRVYEEAPTNTLLMICTAHGDTTQGIRAQEDKLRREARLDDLPPWTERDEEKWAALSNRVVQGLLFAKVKGS